ncbi:MAG: Ldh family oxidoreductase [Pseudomonadota bacterium]
MPVLSLPDLTVLIAGILERHKTDPATALVVARALVAAEADGQKGHGASRVPSYAGQAASGKVDGYAEPLLEQLAAPAAVVDAKAGFAYPAIAIAQTWLREALREAPVAAVAIRNSHHSGVAAHHVEPLAEDGFLALSLGNGPHAIAPWGGNKGLFGTNPLGFAAPRDGAAPLVIDMSLSKVARGKINVAAQAGETIPEGWAFDASGAATTDPEAAMAGTMAPMGDAKGAQLVLMVEIMAAALSASCFGYEASSFFAAEGTPPRVGQFLLAIDPRPFSGGMFGTRLEDLIGEIEAQPGARLPGLKRLAARDAAARDGVTLPDALHAELVALRQE